MDTLTELSRKLENIIRPGTVLAVDTANARCRIESGGLQTTWVPWLACRAGADKTWTAPSQGEQVLLLSPSGNPAQGIALLGLYSNDSPAPSNSPDEAVITFRDGTRVSYNTLTHHLQADIAGSAAISASGNVAVSSEGNIAAQAAGEIIAQAAAASVTAATITFIGTVIINGALQLNGPLSAGPGGAGGGATIDGSVEISGSIAATSVEASGVSLSTHTHGSGASGPPDSPEP